MRLSLQLYTVRDALAADYAGTLAQIKNIGLEYVEGAGNYGGGSPEEGRKILDDLGLKVSGSHVGIEALESDLDATIAQAKTIGCPFIIVPWIGEDVYSAGWDKFGQRLIPIAEKLKAAGLPLAYHNHDFEFRPTPSGELGLDVLYGSVSPDLLKAELDLAWVAIGGGDPVTYINKLSNRLPLVHLKDFDATKTPRWRPAGQGTINWDACLQACQNQGVQFGAIELDESPGDPLDAVRESFEFFKSKGLH